SRHPIRASTSTPRCPAAWRSAGCTGPSLVVSPGGWPTGCWRGPWLPAGARTVPAPGSQPRRRADALLAGPWLSGRADVFAHGERESMKAVRAALKTRLGDGDQLSLSGYWAAGRTEDGFQSAKGQPIGKNRGWRGAGGLAGEPEYGPVLAGHGGKALSCPGSGPWSGSR